MSFFRYVAYRASYDLGRVALRGATSHGESESLGCLLPFAAALGLFVAVAVVGSVLTVFGLLLESGGSVPIPSASGTDGQICTLPSASVAPPVEAPAVRPARHGHTPRLVLLHENWLCESREPSQDSRVGTVLPVA